jgi:hypothetical protein
MPQSGSGVNESDAPLDPIHIDANLSHIRPDAGNIRRKGGLVQFQSMQPLIDTANIAAHFTKFGAQGFQQLDCVFADLHEIQSIRTYDEHKLKMQRPAIGIEH